MKKNYFCKNIKTLWVLRFTPVSLPKLYRKITLCRTPANCCFCNAIEKGRNNLLYYSLIL